MARTRSRFLTHLLTAAGLFLALPSCRKSQPQNLEECLLRAAEHTSAEAILVAQRVCHDVFDKKHVRAIRNEPLWFVNYDVCVSMQIQPDGSMPPMTMGCLSAKFEQVGNGKLRFLCREWKASRTNDEVPHIYELDESATTDEELAFKKVSGASSGGHILAGQVLRFYRSESACEVTITPQDRALAETQMKKAIEEYKRMKEEERAASLRGK